MYADTLLALERAHLLRLLVWAVGSVVAGSFLLALVVLRRAAGPTALLRHFAIQTAAWGAVDLGIVGWAWRGLALRDHAGATGLDRFLWLNLGLDAGYVGVGLTLLLCGRWIAAHVPPPDALAGTAGDRPGQGAVGAGLGVIVQGAALFVLDLVLVRQLQGAL